MARKKYDEAFRGEAVRLVRDGRRDGKSIERVAKNLSVHPNTLREWLRRDDSTTRVTRRTAVRACMRSWKSEAVA